MPELPEVETVRKTLEALVKGKTIEHVEVFWPKMVKQPEEVQQFKDALVGQTIWEIGRRGKFLIFFLDDYSLVSHLRMEGKYGVFPKNTPIEKHTHVIFSFQDGMELRYKDVRKFGTMHLFSKGEEQNALPLVQLGPEPLSETFTTEYLKEKIKGTKRNIKSVLLDQTAVVGIGNIYVDEALFRSGIHPARLAYSLTDDEIERLVTEIKATLSEAVELGGSTIRSYLNSQGQIGMFQLRLFVYGRTGESCKRCGTPIEKLKVAGRGTHICPQCQPFMK
ncbi:DNA-formamidopyrimidine glycosylase [Peribacillus tepidiphilus]|jgi:formamidopyrimidine-DNA glycosylase|uniref:DNA-formamidopyrimidine glycosylase n=1 Tax=Peribacillus tepidiphilus TaxID=2652445 RepID=UPI001291908A|nr:DNA-formamidopyrimidine glycosylase [Peribacillus tepidiphilus]